MSRCPDGLSGGFGVPAALRGSICMTKSYFGVVQGSGVYRTGSGALFRTRGASSFVVTAGHNVFDHGSGRTALWVSLWFGRIGDTSMADREGRDYQASPAFVAAATPIASEDFAVVRVTALGADRFTPIRLADPAQGDPPRKLVVGYPDENGCRGVFRPGNVVVATRPSGTANYAYSGEPTYTGMSGGPLLARTPADDEVLAWGLHIRGERDGPDDPRAVRFNARIREHILDWT